MVREREEGVKKIHNQLKSHRKRRQGFMSEQNLFWMIDTYCMLEK